MSKFGIMLPCLFFYLHLYTSTCFSFRYHSYTNSKAYGIYDIFRLFQLINDYWIILISFGALLCPRIEVMNVQSVLRKHVFIDHIKKCELQPWNFWKYKQCRQIIQLQYIFKYISIYSPRRLNVLFWSSQWTDSTSTFRGKPPSIAPW